ncbi:hypothetical protein EMMF5_005351 [Cystobasidiomycetes sp. EMM_F5]
MDDRSLRAKFHADEQERAARRHPVAYADAEVLPEEVDDAAVNNAIDVPGHIPQQTGYEVPGYRPPPAVPPSQIPGATQSGTTGLQGSTGNAGPTKGSDGAQKTGMKHHLQLLCGPMLRYDTTVDGVYHLFALVVTRDDGSDYSTSPYVTYRYDTSPNAKNSTLVSAMQNMKTNGSNSEQSFKASGEKIWIYHSLTGGNSFWRMRLEVRLSPNGGMPVHYSLNGGREITFFVPGLHENFRWVGHSCNGFSAGVDTEAFNGPDPLWNDLLRKHAENPIHVLVGGGDQIYCDAIAREPELLPWIDEPDDRKKMDTAVSPEIRNGAFGRAIACIPMLNMLDDHDLIDGFGSYPDDLQRAPVFSHIGSRGIFFYKLFQLFQCDEVDGTGLDMPHPVRSLIKGGPGPYVPFDNNSFLSYLGPNSGVVGFTGLVNRMNKDAELLDDLNDHWTAKHHKAERNWLVLELQKIAAERRMRVSIISGDVHLAAVGRFFDKRKPDAALDPKYMLNVVSSAIGKLCKNPRPGF